MYPRNRPGVAGELLPGEYWKHSQLETPVDFPGPLRASVRGARAKAAPRRNFLLKLIMPKNLCKAGLSDGRVLGQGQTSVGGEQVSEKLDLGHSKFTLGETNCQPMLTTEEENLAEIVDVGGEILAEN